MPSPGNTETRRSSAPVSFATLVALIARLAMPPQVDEREQERGADPGAADPVD
ncbi:hypothetical protein [Labrenzia sp. 011]|uniref:hypothetical protein n=1 Tax=Labrenzia sp. 011 TaxID=2171494 RepID=UPI00140281BD|nr:hypothetical protein [Labrenzia sp. 011]